MKFSYKFPAVLGKQAGNDYYITMIPLELLDRLFQEEEFVDSQFRAQRRLNVSRIPQIKQYILNNPENYVFSALAASINGEFEFIESNQFSGVGVLEIDMAAEFLINDGQHRKAAIIEALKENPELGKETISVVFYKDMGLKRSQQMFTDLNKHAVKTSNSIAELFDSRDTLAVATRNVINNIPFLNEYTDMERDNLGKYSSSLFTLNTYYGSNRRILGKKTASAEDERFLECYWRTVIKNIYLWSDLINREITKTDLREKYIVNQAVIIQALGIVGHTFYLNPDVDMETVLAHLATMSWSRNDRQWHGRIINERGKVISGEKAITSAACVIKRHLGLALTEEELYKEKKMFNI